MKFNILISLLFCFNFLSLIISENATNEKCTIKKSNEKSCRPKAHLKKKVKKLRMDMDADMAMGVSAGGQKVLYSNPKILKEGDKFCQTKCKINTKDKTRKCLEYGVIGCNVCDSNLKTSDPNYKNSQLVCNTFCNKYNKSKNCRFYEFSISVKKKKIPTSALKAFNLEKVAHRNVKA